MDEVIVGNKLRMTDLRRGEQHDVTVIAVDGDGRVLVQRDDNGAQYRVGTGFLSLRRHADD
jgi:hypothetical protein